MTAATTTQAGDFESILHERVAAARGLDELEGYRGLRTEEIAALESDGNVSDSWSNVYVQEASPSLVAAPHRIMRCYFYGRNLLSGNLGGTIEVEEGLRHPEGLYDSTFSDAVIGSNVLIKATQLLSSVVIERGARIIGCGTVACTRLTTFGAGTEIRVGSEVAGRPIVTYPEMTMKEVLPQAQKKAHPDFCHDAYIERVATYLEKATSKRAFICEGAYLLRAGRVINSFLGPHSVVMDSTVEESTVLSSAKEKTVVLGGSKVHQSVLQWSVKVDGMAVIKQSLIMEHSSVKDKAVVDHTVLCPDGGIALGECYHSLLGPFIGFHHLSLAIAVVWPQGRGNIAHGAKVGANHTGRVADQEAVVGEGVFFGLSAIAKFPVDLSDSIYTLVAAGTALDPQKLHFPFSLVAQSRESHAAPHLAGLTQIRPAWILAHSPYTVFRNEEKYAKRSKAKRHVLTWKVFRPHSIDLIVTARDRLRTAQKTPAKYYTQKEIPGLGGNLVTAKSVEEGIHAYTAWIKRYALQGLLDRLRASHNTSKDEGEASVWEHQMSILWSEVDCSRPLSEALNELSAIESTIAVSVETCKARDDDRGAATIDDYADTHTPAARDSVVLGVRQRLDGLQKEVDAIGNGPRGRLSVREVLSDIPTPAGQTARK